MDPSYRVLKEPRGFIRCIQLVMALFAFSTTAGFTGVTSFHIKCDSFELNPEYIFGYPFNLQRAKLRIPERCLNYPDIVYKTYTFSSDFSSGAQFFVATGVLSFMFTIGITFVYVFLHQQYSSKGILAIVDFVVTGVLSLFWFAGSCAWAKAVTDLKFHTNPDNLLEWFSICSQPDVCHSTSSGNFAQLNVSLVFGFANWLLWLSSLWFVFKETKFHSQNQPAQMVQNQQTPLTQEQANGRML